MIFTLKVAQFNCLLMHARHSAMAFHIDATQVLP
jgi:hypothetical protein